MTLMKVFFLVALSLSCVFGAISVVRKLERT